MKTRIVWLTIALALGGSIALWCWAFSSTGVAQDTPRPLPLVTPRNDAADEMPLVEPPKGEYGLITPRVAPPAPPLKNEPFNGCAYNRGYRDGFKAGISEGTGNSMLFSTEIPQPIVWLGIYLLLLVTHFVIFKLLGPRSRLVENIARQHFQEAAGHFEKAIEAVESLYKEVNLKLDEVQRLVQRTQREKVDSRSDDPEEVGCKFFDDLGLAENDCKGKEENDAEPTSPAWRGGAVCLLLCSLAICGCSVKTEPRSGVGSASEPAVIEAPVPVPPLKPEKSGSSSGVPFQQAQAAQPQGTPLIVDDPAPSSSGPRPDDPMPLADLLDMRSISPAEDESAVKKMRPSAIREAAHMVTLQSAIAWRYGQLLDAVGRHEAIMDTAFNFGPLMMTQGDALIMPPVLTRAGASLRIDDEDTATSATTSYELLQKARYVSVVPHWRTYLMADGGLPAPEQPNPAVLPKNGKERDIWRAAVREAWAQGVEEADALFVDNVSRMVRDYRGVMLYHLLTAQHLLSRVGTSSAMLGSRVSGNKMALGQHVYRITSPAVFTPPTSKKSGKTETRKRRRR